MQLADAARLWVNSWVGLNERVALQVRMNLLAMTLRNNGIKECGPQQIFAKIPGLGTTFKMLTKVWPLGRGTVSVSGNDIVVE
jgi:hypothetical protein